MGKSSLRLGDTLNGYCEGAVSSDEVGGLDGGGVHGHGWGGIGDLDLLDFKLVIHADGRDAEHLTADEVGDVDVGGLGSHGRHFDDVYVE